MNPSNHNNNRGSTFSMQSKPMNSYTNKNGQISNHTGNHYTGMGYNNPSLPGNSQYGNYPSNYGMSSLSNNNPVPTNNLMYNSGGYPYNYNQIHNSNSTYGQPQHGMTSNNPVYRSSSQNMHSNNYSTKKKVQQMQNPNYMNKPYNNYASSYDNNDGQKDNMRMNTTSNVGGGSYSSSGANNNMYNNYSTIPFTGPYYGLPKTNSTYKKN